MKFLLAILWMLPPEIAHSIALNSLKLLHKLKLINLFFPFKFSNSPFYFKNYEPENKKEVNKKSNESTIQRQSEIESFVRGLTEEEKDKVREMLDTT